jgi:6-phosphogluconolactonase
MRGSLEVFQSVPALVQAAATRIAELLTRAIESRGFASLVLSGGLTPRGVYELLGSGEYQSRIRWHDVHLFWGDERCVPPSMPGSNFRMVNESLLKNVLIPSANVHRFGCERAPEDAARSYEQELKKFFALEDGTFPRFDLLLLGLGEDGHTASLFPGTPVLAEKSRLVASVFVEKLKAHRVTLTLPVINNSRAVMFLVSGRSKRDILQQVLEAGGTACPAQQVSPTSGELYWMADQEAASQLRTVSQK